jgi:hypothetical protein
MGLFDAFKGDTESMSPIKALTISMIYMISADGEVANEEVGQLLAVIGGARSKRGVGVGGQNEKLLQSAVKYTQSHSVDQFLGEANEVMDDAQKLCTLLNMLDSLLSDGHADPKEQGIFQQFLTGFGYTEEDFQSYFDIIAKKNDRSVFNT